MIEIYTGFPGSGKSFHATARGCQVADAPLGKKWVIANFPIKPKMIGMPWNRRLNEPRWIFKPNNELTVPFLVELAHSMGWYGKESQALLIFDEAGIPFNSRDWNVKPAERMGWIQFLSQHRKFGYDIVFISQDVRMIDRQIRSLAEYEVQHKKVNNWGVLRFMPVTVFAAVSFWNGLRNLRGSLTMTIYKKKTADRYDSMALFGYTGGVPGGEGGPAQAGGPLPPGMPTIDNRKQNVYDRRIPTVYGGKNDEKSGNDSTEQAGEMGASQGRSLPGDEQGETVNGLPGGHGVSPEQAV